MEDLRVVRFDGSCSAVLPCAAVVVKDVVLLVLFPTYIAGVVDDEEHVYGPCRWPVYTAVYVHGP